jgi:hypothetical protein
VGDSGVKLRSPLLFFLITRYDVTDVFQYYCAAAAREREREGKKKK